MEFSIKELTALAHFSYVGSSFSEFERLDDSTNQKYFAKQNIHAINEQNLGKPYFMSLTLKGSGDPYVFPNEPLVSISLQKTIIQTATVGEGRKGTVKEYICTEDYEIDIKGIIIGTNNAYPAKEVSELNELFKRNETLNIIDNMFFNVFGIQRIVLKTIKFDEMLGQESLQKYSITAISDEPFFAQLTNRYNLK